MQMLTGTCTCNSIEYTAEPDAVVARVNCHCSVCRKLSGAAFNSYIGVKSEGFKITKGEDNLSVYNKPNSTITKHFCKTCGTPMFNLKPKLAGINIVYLGTFAEGNGLKPDMNIFCDDKLDWLDGLFDCANYGQGPDV